MKRQSKEKNIKYPENLTYKQVLRRKDSFEIAELSGFSAEHVRKVLRGERLLDDKIVSAIEKILRRREALNKRVVEQLSKVSA